MPNRPPIAPTDPAVPQRPSEAPCRDPEGPATTGPEYAPPAPDRCVPDSGAPETWDPEDRPPDLRESG